MYNLGDKTSNGVDLFTSIIQSIIDGYIESNNINILSYKGSVSIKLNKDICIIIDETQDLPENYASALIKIMRGRYIDLYIVGDKLQSIQYEHNAFNYFEKDFSYINKICTIPINKCRRFINQRLVNFCNSVVAFDDYKLPKIEPYRFEEETSSTLEFINVDECHKNRTKLNKNTEKIMEKYKFEVKNNNCQPNDFLFVTPFTKNNVLVESIELAINQYWINKNGDTEYIRYAIFHKSEAGTSIDTNLSINTTRIVSIHSAKGDGRKIVFVIGCNEISLKKTDSPLFSSILPLLHNNIQIIGDSHILSAILKHNLFEYIFVS
jgi:superfamily I DNA/RNA helicase